MLPESAFTTERVPITESIKKELHDTIEPIAIRISEKTSLEDANYIVLR